MNFFEIVNYMLLIVYVKKCHENRADQVQTTSEEAVLSGLSLFAIILSLALYE